MSSSAEPRSPRRAGAVARATIALLALAGAAPAADFTSFESGHVRPLALSPDGTRLFAVNTPDARLEIFDVDEHGLRHAASVAVGLEPVAVAARSADEAWVVNHLSDSVSVVDARGAPRVRRTLLVGDEPRDIVFAGPDRRRAFVTAAHRGQNSPIDPQPFAPGIGRADVWVFDAAAVAGAAAPAPETIVTLFGDTPRSLAATADGRTVYAAIFLSGNRTTTVAEEAVCDGGAAAPSCTLDGVAFPGGLPAPNVDAQGVAGPETGLIVRWDEAAQAWHDELGRNWNDAARFRLPDLDVFALDAFADPPVQVRAWSGVGTVLYDLAVDPASGALLASNTEARNEVRLEPRLRGHQHESRLTLIEGDRVAPRRLNKHLDAAREALARSLASGEAAAPPAPDPALAARSLALPQALAISADGATVYLAAHGSSRVAVLDLAALREDRASFDAREPMRVSGGGPSGLALDAPRGRLYVATRFDNGISIVDLEAAREIDHLRLHDPEPEAVRRGRPWLYDAEATSSEGEATCASCHVFGDLDGLAWDLGDPAGTVEINPLPLLNAGGREGEKDFHPLKGPMTTQTLQGMANHGAMHWRGDRNGAASGAPAMDERAALRRFNPAFVGLLGRGEPLAERDMEDLVDFLLALTPPPNPYRPLDNQLTPAQQQGRDAFFRNGCFECHDLDPARGHFGTASFAAINAVAPQFMKVPQLRNVYRKIGRFWGVLFDPLADTEPAGDQIRGFGFSHDGSAGRTGDPADEFLLAFDSNLAPIVGQQVTLSPPAPPEGAADPARARLLLLAQRQDAGECDLVARAVVAGEERGWLRLGNGAFQGDRSGEALLSEAELLATGAPVTFTCVPAGWGRRAALDRDRDGALDGDERRAGSDPADAASLPPLPGDCDGDRALTIEDLRAAIPMVFGASAPCRLESLDRNGDRRLVAAELLAPFRAAAAVAASGFGERSSRALRSRRFP